MEWLERIHLNFFDRIVCSLKRQIQAQFPSINFQKSLFHLDSWGVRAPRVLKFQESNNSSLTLETYKVLSMKRAVKADEDGTMINCGGWCRTSAGGYGEGGIKLGWVRGEKKPENSSEARSRRPSREWLCLVAYRHVLHKTLQTWLKHRWDLWTPIDAWKDRGVPMIWT